VALSYDDSTINIVVGIIIIIIIISQKLTSGTGLTENGLIKQNHVCAIE